MAAAFSGRIAVLAMLCVILAACGGRGGSAVLDTRSPVDVAVGQVKPSLVRIAIVEPAYYGGREQNFVATGSGTIITPEGHIITNHHVAGKAVRIMCTMPNREEIPARLVGTDPATDIAVIQLIPPTPRAFPYVAFGDSDALRAGDTVLALGSPLGLSQSVTMGIVSNTEMVMPSIFSVGGLELDGENVGELVRWIGHDAMIHGGNSGGPIIDLEGRIVGINEISFGLAGAIPGNLARDVANAIIAECRVRRAYTGMVLQPRLKSQADGAGVLVSTVLKGSPAETAGVQPGDFLLSVNGTALEARFAEDMPVVHNVLARLNIDKPAALEVERGGARMPIEVTPKERPSAMMPEEELRPWGITARDLSMWTDLSMAREGRGGVLITSVRAGGPGAKAKPPLQPGDILLSVEGESVPSLDGLRDLTRARAEASPEGKLVPVLVEFERRRERTITVVEIGIEELDDPGVELQRSWLPMETQVLTREVARQMDIPNQKGVRVTRLYTDRPADFPFQVGDLIIAMDGDPIEAAEPHDSELFRTMLRQYRIGMDIAFDVLRGGERQTLTAKTVPSPLRSREMGRFRDLDFGFVLRESTFYDREDERLAGIDVSVLVESVEEGSWASLAGLRSSDVLVMLDGKAIVSLDDARTVMADIQSRQPSTVSAKVRRGVQFVFLEFELMWERELAK
jgi:serine protease Do